jgi:hypothetical protein
MAILLLQSTQPCDVRVNVVSERAPEQLIQMNAMAVQQTDMLHCHLRSSNKTGAHQVDSVGESDGPLYMSNLVFCVYLLFNVGANSVNRPRTRTLQSIEYNQIHSRLDMLHRHL